MPGDHVSARAHQNATRIGDGTRPSGICAWRAVYMLPAHQSIAVPATTASVVGTSSEMSALLTLRTGYSPTGSRFTAAAYATTPRRCCPRHTMFLAAFASRSSMSPQLVQTWVRMDRLLCIRAPQPEQSWDVYAGGTASTRFPAHAALKARIVRKWRHPAS